jgi:hypothetical protein
VIRVALVARVGALAALIAIGCGPRDERWHSFAAEEGEPSLLVVFRRGTPMQAITEALDRFSSTPHPGGGVDLRPGIRSLVNTSVHNHVAYALAFRSDSSPDQIALVERLAKQEASVLAVFRDLPASQVNPESLPDESD